MRGLLVMSLVSVCALAAGCGDEGSHRAADPVPTEGPITAPVTARGLTAGLLGHLDPDHVSWYGGQHSPPVMEMESWSASADLDGDISMVFLFAQRTLDSYDPGCDPDAPFYTELSCTTAPNGARRSLMQHTGGRDRMPLLQGRTLRADGTSFLVELWADKATDEAKELVLELLDDEALGALTTEGLNAAGEALDDYHELEISTEVGTGAP
jgi:hypothetical protein